MVSHIPVKSRIPGNDVRGVVVAIDALYILFRLRSFFFGAGCMTQKLMDFCPLGILIVNRCCYFPSVWSFYYSEIATGISSFGSLVNPSLLEYMVCTVAPGYPLERWNNEIQCIRDIAQ